MVEINYKNKTKSQSINLSEFNTLSVVVDSTDITFLSTATQEVLDSFKDELYLYVKSGKRAVSNDIDSVARTVLYTNKTINFLQGKGFKACNLINNI